MSQRFLRPILRACKLSFSRCHSFVAFSLPCLLQYMRLLYGFQLHPITLDYFVHRWYECELLHATGFPKCCRMFRYEWPESRSQELKSIERLEKAPEKNLSWKLGKLHKECKLQTWNRATFASFFVQLCDPLFAVAKGDVIRLQSSYFIIHPLHKLNTSKYSVYLFASILIAFFGPQKFSLFDLLCYRLCSSRRLERRALVNFRRLRPQPRREPGDCAWWHQSGILWADFQSTELFPWGVPPSIPNDDGFLMVGSHQFDHVDELPYVAMYFASQTCMKSCAEIKKKASLQDDHRRDLTRWPFVGLKYVEIEWDRIEHGI